jgi:hypothetical protein
LHLFGQGVRIRLSTCFRGKQPIATFLIIIALTCNRQVQAHLSAPHVLLISKRISAIIP